MTICTCSLNTAHNTTHNRDSDRAPHVLTYRMLASYQRARLETYATVHMHITVYGYLQSVRLRANVL